MKEVLQEQATEEAALLLAAAMLRSGLLGSATLTLGWLLHVDVLQTFRCALKICGLGVLQIEADLITCHHMKMHRQSTASGVMAELAVAA